MKHHVEFDLELKKNPYPGLYIAVEGIDASGKSTQVEKLTEYFQKKGERVLLVNEPSNKGVTGRLIREILSGTEKIPMTAFQFIFTADRTIQFENAIIPALKEGNAVLSARSFWSALPYGIMDKGESEYKDDDINLLLVAQGILSMYHQFIIPDYTFYLKISAETAMQRLSGMGKKKEIYEQKSKLERLVKGYDWVANKFSDVITVIDGEQSIEKVANSIVEVVKKQIVR